MNDNNKKVFFVGSSSEDLKKFIEIISINYPSIEIVGCKSGYDLDSSAAINQIVIKEIDTLIVGMGTPMQEDFIVKAKLRGFKGSSYVCGAFFSQTAENGTTYYPNVVTKLHLRWMYRIYKEPKLFKRYLIDYPKGLFYITGDWFRNSNHLL